jgi:hypothetical protein
LGTQRPHPSITDPIEKLDMAIVTATILTFRRPAARFARHSRRRKLIGKSLVPNLRAKNKRVVFLRYYFSPLRAALAQVRRSWLSVNPSKVKRAANKSVLKYARKHDSRLSLI